MYGYSDVLEAEDNLFPDVDYDDLPEWNQRDCDALPMQQMMQCAQIWDMMDMEQNGSY